ncbi:MAG: hypothetical protein BWZ08_01598 [candidate division BRC1 bacterium ADurb.BinA292]|nr:MAG: hypothetical protein BWZ08_01598 [candidate division BRC1 bacterium ADurb.BinA292]
MRKVRGVAGGGMDRHVAAGCRPGCRRFRTRVAGCARGDLLIDPRAGKHAQAADRKHDQQHVDAMIEMPAVTPRLLKEQSQRGGAQQPLSGGRRGRAVQQHQAEPLGEDGRAQSQREPAVTARGGRHGAPPEPGS